MSLVAIARRNDHDLVGQTDCCWYQFKEIPSSYMFDLEPIGSFGTSVLIRIPGKRPYVVKVLRNFTQHESHLRELLSTEKEFLVQYEEMYISTEDNTIYLLMDYHQEGNLEAFLLEEPAPITYADTGDDDQLTMQLITMKHLAICLENLHYEGHPNAHGNIHIGNFLKVTQVNHRSCYSRWSPWKLADYGIASCVFCNNTEERDPDSFGHYRGLYYQSPEFFLEEYSPVDLKMADIFSLGCIFEIFLRYSHRDISPKQFDGMPLGKALADVMKGNSNLCNLKLVDDTESDSEVRKKIKELILKMTSVCADERLEAAQVVHALHQISMLFELILTDRGLYDLAKKIGAQWDHIGLNLGIDLQQLDTWKQLYDPAKTGLSEFEPCVHMLRTWKRESEKTPSEQIVELCDALVLSGREDVHRYILGFPDNLDQNKKHIFRMAKLVGDKWQSLGEGLGIAGATLQEIKCACSTDFTMATVKVVDAWHKTNRNIQHFPTYLKQALQDLDLHHALLALEGPTVSGMASNVLELPPNPVEMVSVPTIEDVSARVSQDDNDDMHQENLIAIMLPYIAINFQEISHGITACFYDSERKKFIITVKLDQEKQAIEECLSRNPPEGITPDNICVTIVSTRNQGLGGQINTGDTIFSKRTNEGGRIGLFAEDKFNRKYIITTLHNLCKEKGKVILDWEDFVVKYNDDHGQLNAYPFKAWCVGYNSAFQHSFDHRPTIVDIAAVRFPETSQTNASQMNEISNFCLFSDLDKKKLPPFVKIVKKTDGKVSLHTAKIIANNAFIKYRKMWCGGNIILRELDGEKHLAEAGDSGSLVISEVDDQIVALGLLREKIELENECHYTVMNLEMGMQCLKQVLGLELKINKSIVQFTTTSETAGIETRVPLKEETEEKDESEVVLEQIPSEEVQQAQARIGGNTSGASSWPETSSWTPAKYLGHAENDSYDREDVEAGYVSPQKEQEKPRILLLGLRRSGKTSISRVVFHKMSPDETLFLESTNKIVTDDISSGPFVQFSVWDFPGQMNLVDPEFVESIFAGCKILIVVIDAQDDMQPALSNLQDRLHQAHKVNPNIKFEVFIHKVDGLSDDQKIETQKDVHQRTADDLAEEGLTGLPISYYQTSIYDYSIFEAFSKVIQKLIPQTPALENLLNIFITSSGVEKAFLFDVISKIYIATDSSPVDMQSYELCCDVIDLVMDVSCVYGSTSEDVDELEVFDEQSTSMIKLNNYSKVVYLREVTQGLALVCIIPEDSTQRQGLIDYNFHCLRQAIQAVFDVKTKKKLARHQDQL